MIRLTDFDDQLSELIEWRRDFHAHPKLTFDVERTVGLIAHCLAQMGGPVSPVQNDLAA